ncbi:MAG TPA: MraY family glycosyltransferase [Verrucomicrobiae bacterium]|nr:MraY family glycosyltransferase [Verrucomicrobiae bacterium]
MEMWSMIGCAVTGFLICWWLIPVLQRRVAQAGHRDFHHEPSAGVSRFGGVGIFSAFAVVSVVAAALHSFEPLQHAQTWGVLLGALAMFGLGWRDDCKPIGAKLKLVGQIVIAGGVFWSGVQIDQFREPLTGTAYQLGPWSFPATVFWLVALTNLINLIDGIDGLAGGIALMLMGLLACFGFTHDPFSLLLTVGAAGAILGFLCYNFPPAKIYMGDGGAYFLGFLIGALTITSSHKGTIAAGLIAPLFALALPIADVLLAILRRGLQGLPIFRPDRKHIHHRLVEFGLTRRGAVLVLYGLSLSCSVLALVVFWSRGQLAPILVGALFLLFFFSARLFGFVKDWHAIGRELGISLSLRKETRYALTLCEWLELEAERCESLQELWTTYLFITRKLGLAQVKLVLEDGRKVTREQAGSGQTDFHRHRRELPLANIRAIEFASESSAMSPRLFEHLTELAAEAWMKAVHRWQDVNRMAAVFEPAVPSETTFFSRGRALISNVA